MKRAWHGLLLAALLVVAACNGMGLSGYLADIQVNETTKKLFDKGLKMTLDGGDETVNFTATESWTIDITSGTKAIPSWVSVTPMSGEAGPSSIAINVEPNTGEKMRSADITIKAGSGSRTLKVLQPGTKESLPDDEGGTSGGSGSDTPGSDTPGTGDGGGDYSLFIGQWKVTATDESNETWSWIVTITDKVKGESFWVREWESPTAEDTLKSSFCVSHRPKINEPASATNKQI